METWYSSDFATIEVDTASELVVATQTEIPYTELYREYMDEIVAAFQQRPVCKLVADTSDCSGRLSDADKSWTAEKWSWKAADAGLEYVGIVMPQSVVTNMVVDEIVKKDTGAVEQRAFSTEEDAMEWVESVDCPELQ